MNRQEANQELIKLLQEIMVKHPDQRFSQILSNYGFVASEKDEFYTEPQVILERVKNKLKIEK